jgi:hypothetical protein
MTEIDPKIRDAIIKKHMMIAKEKHKMTVALFVLIIVDAISLVGVFSKIFDFVEAIFIVILACVFFQIYLYHINKKIKTTIMEEKYEKRGT